MCASLLKITGGNAILDKCCIVLYQVLSATFLQQGPNVKKNSKFFVICYLGNFIVKKLQNKSAKAKCKSEKGRIYSLYLQF